MAPSVFDPSRLSVVICTKDRPADLACAIASIRASGDVGRSAEIVVVEEADAPREIPGIRYVHLPRSGRGFGYARNTGVREAHGDVPLFIDDDCEAEQEWAEALVEPFQRNPHVLGVAGAVLVKDCGLIGYAENILGAPGGGLRYLHDAQGRVVPTRYLSTCNCAYRRKTVLEAGGFLEDARLGGEDTLLAERVTALGSCVYRSEEHTSELQSLAYLVCRLLLEKKKKTHQVTLSTRSRDTGAVPEVSPLSGIIVLVTC